MAGVNVPFGVDGRAYRTGLAVMRKQTKQWSGDIKSTLASAFTVQAFTSLIRNAIDFGSTMSDIAIQTGVSVKEFTALRDITRNAGVSQEILARALRNVRKRSQDAVDGNLQYQKSFQRLGIDVERFVNLPTARKLEEVAKAAMNATNENEAFKDVAVIIGEKAGPALTEVLQALGRDGFEKLAESAKTMSDETAQSLDTAADAIARFKDNVTITVGTIIAAYADLISNTRSSIEQFDAATEKNARAIRRLKQEGIEFSAFEEEFLKSPQIGLDQKTEILEKRNVTFAKFAALRRKDSKDALQDELAESRAKQQADQSEQKGRIDRLKNEERMKKAREDISRLRKADMERQLTDDQKLIKLMERRLELEGKAGDFTADQLEAKKELLEVTKEIDTIEAKQAEQRRKSQEQFDKIFKRFEGEPIKIDAELVSAEEERRRGEKDNAQKEFLDRMNRQLLESQIRSDAIPTATVSQLQALGGGAAISGASINPELQEAQRQTQVLQDIRNLLSASQGLNAPRGLNAGAGLDGGRRPVL